MFGVVPKAVWSRLVSPDEDNCIPLQTNCLLLEMDGSRVLIETGNGSKWSPKERALSLGDHFEPFPVSMSTRLPSISRSRQLV